MRAALDDPNVHVRYYTDQSFHAKLYIIDDVAMVGSANLTQAGLQKNREISVVLRRDRDAAFGELPGLFDLLWDHADVLTPPVLKEYEKAWAQRPFTPDDGQFESLLAGFVDPCEPPTIRVGSEKVSRRRSFLQSFRRKYDETLNPAFEEVRQAFLDGGDRRPEFVHGDLDIELSRFLGWVRIVHAPGDDWFLSPLLDATGRRARIDGYRQEWLETDDITNGDMINAERELGNIARIRANLGSAEAIGDLSYDDLFDTLIDPYWGNRNIPAA